MKRLLGILALILSIAALTTLSACSEEAPQTAPEEPEAPAQNGGSGNDTPDPPKTEPLPKSRDIALSPAQASLVDATIENSFKLFQYQDEIERAKGNEAEKNIMLSPLSLSWAMAMLANGAEGDSRAQIIDGMAYSGHTCEEINAFFRYLGSELRSIDPSSKFNIANSMWLRSDYKSRTLSSFVEMLDDDYNAPVGYVPTFESKETLDMLNSWCSKETEGFIDPLFSETLSDDIYLMLANVLYFKGAWINPFDAEKTADADFRNEDGSKSRVKMMQGDALDYEKVVTDDFLALRLPYGNEAFSMSLILPAENTGIAACIAAMAKDREQLTALAKGEAKEIDNHILRMPKFDFRYDTKLNTLLAGKLGISDIFDGNKSDLSGMFNLAGLGHRPVISDVKQSCRVAVDEKATEAAAVTIIIGAECPAPVEPVEITIDRPFIFLISERSTGLPIYMGRITKL